MEEQNKKFAADKKNNRNKLQKRKAEEKRYEANKVNQQRGFQILQTTELNRSSSPTDFNFCEHCEHQHARTCCMYINDSYSDIADYANFKQALDQPYSITSISDDFFMKVSNTTPKNFPCFTVNDPQVIQQKLQNPVVYLRQYLWPVFFPSTNQQFSNMLTSHPNQFVQYGNVYHQPYPNPIMRQVAIPVGSNYNYTIPPQIIETHGFMPIHFY